MTCRLSAVGGLAPGCTITGNNQRWADDLARRVVKELPARHQVAIANAGIGGTTTSPECVNEPDGVKGLEGTARLDRDVLALHGVTAVIYYYGTNDLQDDCAGHLPPGRVARRPLGGQRVAVRVDVALAENFIRTGQAACSYSWRIPPRRWRLLMSREDPLWGGDRRGDCDR